VSAWDSIAKKIITDLKLTFKSSTSVTLDAETVRYVSMPKKVVSDSVLMDVVSGEQYKKIVQRDSKEPGYKLKFKKKICDAILQDLASAQLKNFQVTSGKLDGNKSFRYQNLSLVTDVVTGKKILFDLDSAQCTPLDVDTWKALLPRDPELRRAILSTSINGLIRYNPYNNSSTQEVPFQGQTVYEVNSHITPMWRREGSSNSSLPPFVEAFMEHLIPDEECRAFVWNWMYLMLTSRCQTFLTLNSVMGTGKGRLAEIMKYLVGLPNYAEASQGFMDSGNKFNSVFRDKRCFVLDETAITEKNKRVLKLIINNHVNFESKGVDADELSPNYASMCITNNYDYNVHLDKNDRRFSVPELADTPLLKSFTQDEIDEFTLSLETDVSYQRQIGRFILGRSYNPDPKWTEFTAWKKKKFYYLVENSLKEWQKFVKDRIESKVSDKYFLDDLTMEYRDTYGSSFAGRAKVEAFLKEYTDKKGNNFGLVKNSGKRRYIEPTNDYLPAKEFDLEDGEDFDI